VGISLEVVWDGDGDKKMACDDEAFALTIGDGGREIHGAEQVGTGSNGCGTLC
jgi:hypothetical protein